VDPETENLNKTMGGSYSYLQEGLTSERALFDMGLRYWIEHSESETQASDLSVEIEDITLQDHPEWGPLHMHTAWVRRSQDPGTLKEAIKEREDSTPIVLLHGYGSGSAIYYASLPGIAERCHTKGPVLAVDSLGCGFSATPSFDRVFNKSKPDVDEVESFFIKGIESLRNELGFEKMILVGHSIGGYLACAYSERHPDRVEKLVLAGCAGVPKKPEDFQEKVNSRSFMMRYLVSLWEKGHSPMTLARVGPGRTLMSGYVNRRFPDRHWIDKPTLTNYLYNNWAATAYAPGAYSHATILSPGAYARVPLIDRIPKIKVPKIEFIYGREDWMNPQHAMDLRDELRGKAGHPELGVCIVNQAGHNLMVDEPFAFIQAMDAAIHHTSDTKEF
jgi:cardiolipin-specific phospholipase